MPENKDEANCKQISFADRGDFKCFSKEANQQKKSQKRKQQPTKRLTAFRIKAMDSFGPVAHYRAFCALLLPQAEKLKVISFLSEYAGTKQIQIGLPRCILYSDNGTV